MHKILQIELFIKKKILSNGNCILISLKALSKVLRQVIRRESMHLYLNA